jgi:hypothetical protein
LETHNRLILQAVVEHRAEGRLHVTLGEHVLGQLSYQALYIKVLEDRIPVKTGIPGD